MKNYISIDTLKAYAAGKLYGAELQAVETYLRENPQERKVVDGLTEYFKDHRLYQWNFRMKMHEIRLFATIRLSQWAQRFQKGVQSLMPSASAVAWLKPILGGACLLSLLVFFLELKPASPSDPNLTQQGKPCEDVSVTPSVDTSENKQPTHLEAVKEKNREKIASIGTNSSQTPKEEGMVSKEKEVYIPPTRTPPVDSSTTPSDVGVIDSIEQTSPPPPIPTQKRQLTKKLSQTGIPAGEQVKK